MDRRRARSASCITAWPAYEFGFIEKDDVLDIFVGTGTGRYVRLGIVTLVWALVTALLVQLFVEGGRALGQRRRRARGRCRHEHPLPLLGVRQPHPLRRVASRRTRAFHHFSVGGELTVEDEEVLDETVETVTCRWCGASGDAIEVLAIEV